MSVGHSTEPPDAVGPLALNSMTFISPVPESSPNMER